MIRGSHETTNEPIYMTRNSATKHSLSHTFVQEISEMNIIELINKHVEMVGGIKSSFALKNDVMESNIFLTHLGPQPSPPSREGTTPLTLALNLPPKGSTTRRATQRRQRRHLQHHQHQLKLLRLRHYAGPGNNPVQVFST
jgi:hypothetical protein